MTLACTCTADVDPVDAHQVPVHRTSVECDATARATGHNDDNLKSSCVGTAARRWAQFRVGVAAWGMEPRNKPLAMEIHSGRYNGHF